MVAVMCRLDLVLFLAALLCLHWSAPLILALQVWCSHSCEVVRW